jgi:hypothetical protein
MKLTEKIERVFSSRPKPQVRDEILQLDFEVEEALWFSGRDWHELTWQDWQKHSSAIVFFDSEAFAHYLPSVLLLSAPKPSEWLQAAGLADHGTRSYSRPGGMDGGFGASLPWIDF